MAKSSSISAIKNLVDGNFYVVKTACKLFLSGRGAEKKNPCLLQSRD
jgi:hypothetical protein